MLCGPHTCLFLQLPNKKNKDWLSRRLRTCHSSSLQPQLVGPKVFEMERARFFSGNELFRVTNYELELVSVSEISRLGWWALEMLRALLEPRKYCNISSSVEPPKKLASLAEIWAQVVSGIGLICHELFFRSGPLTRVGYLFQLYKESELEKPLSERTSCWIRKVAFSKLLNVRQEWAQWTQTLLVF